MVKVEPDLPDLRSGAHKMRSGAQDDAIRGPWWCDPGPKMNENWVGSLKTTQRIAWIRLVKMWMKGMGGVYQELGGAKHPHGGCQKYCFTVCNVWPNPMPRSLSLQRFEGKEDWDNPLRRSRTLSLQRCEGEEDWDARPGLGVRGVVGRRRAITLMVRCVFK